MKKPVELECRKCGHRFTEYIELPMDMRAALSRMKGWEICPKCGAGKKYICMVGGVFQVDDE